VTSGPPVAFKSQILAEWCQSRRVQSQYRTDISGASS